MAGSRICVSAFAVLVLAVVFLLLLFPFIASAQDPSKYELSAGYAYMRVDSSAGGLSLHGISFSLAWNLNRWFALSGDGGGYHLEGFRLGTVQAGARVTARPGHRVSLFSQALIGFAHANAGGRGFPEYHDSVAWTVGGGVDWRAADWVSLRLAQTEYLQTRLGGQMQHNFRAGTGIVFHFGGFQ